jgi:hypothetical protein
VELTTGISNLVSSVIFPTENNNKEEEKQKGTGVNTRCFLVGRNKFRQFLTKKI